MRYEIGIVGFTAGRGKGKRLRGGREEGLPASGKKPYNFERRNSADINREKSKEITK